MASTKLLAVRPFEPQDVKSLLNLMKGLAQFEGYLDQFNVTEDDLITYGLGDEPKFCAYVAEHAGGDRSLLGMAVTYLIPWTYDRRPILVLKELFVAKNARGAGVGRRLMERVRQQAQEVNASAIHWTVLRNNENAKRFYRLLGAVADPVWERWTLSMEPS